MCARKADVVDENRDSFRSKLCWWKKRSTLTGKFFLSVAIDDAARAPMIIFAAGGGTGIEERAAATRRIPCDVNRGPSDSAVDEAAGVVRTLGDNANQLNESIRKLFFIAASALSKRGRWKSTRWW